MIIIILSEGLLNTANLFQYITYKNGTALLCGPSNTIAIVANFSTSMLRSAIPVVFMIVLDFLIIKIFICF